MLAQHLRVQTTRRWGSIWTIDGLPLGQLSAGAATDPVRRAFALIALQDRHGFAARPYLEDDESLVRLAAASVIAAPAGVTEAKAARVVDALSALLAEERAEYRAAAAGALGPWIFREQDFVRLAAAADSDPDPAVRAAALRSCGKSAPGGLPNGVRWSIAAPTPRQKGATATKRLTVQRITRIVNLRGAPSSF
ncbi:MAG: hypothetical protein GY711_07035 [bacterium]|nr:hypothetical protein [bacterium]